MHFSQLLGFLGTGLVIIAYVPQVVHVIKEHCSAGISVKAYELWFTASVLFLIHAVTIGDLVFAMAQVANLLAMGVVLAYVKRFQNQMCRIHLEAHLEPLEHLG
ncbi:MAG TPA: PQ-loop repeat-containing protein [Candidatus Paceibacterota bacterium]|jgi:uncharacterized protein with PQ loop repeat|nr:PQ-loop repeat-containing protein [Candidatus Paceibacterota bacterium]